MTMYSWLHRALAQRNYELINVVCADCSVDLTSGFSILLFQGKDWFYVLMPIFLMILKLFISDFFIMQQTVSFEFLTIYTRPSLFINLIFIPVTAVT